jgi:hypothetical protein
VELLIDRVIVTDEEVEIRYVIPTDPSSEHVRFCHLRTDYSGYPQAMKQHREFASYGYCRLFLCVLAVSRGYLFSVASEIRILCEGAKDVVSATYQKSP